MKSSKQVWINLALCIAALVVPACGGASGAPDTTATAAALTNKADDDHDGRIDESGEGSDEDADGKVDESAEHEDACAKLGHHGRRRDPGEARESRGDDGDDVADDVDESADEASDDVSDDTDESTDEASDDTDESADEADHPKGHDSDRDELDCSDMVEETADAGLPADESAEDSSN